MKFYGISIKTEDDKFLCKYMIADNFIILRNFPGLEFSDSYMKKSYKNARKIVLKPLNGIYRKILHMCWRCIPYDFLSTDGTIGQFYIDYVNKENKTYTFIPTYDNIIPLDFFDFRIKNFKQLMNFKKRFIRHQKLINLIKRIPATDLEKRHLYYQYVDFIFIRKDNGKIYGFQDSKNIDKVFIFRKLGQSIILLTKKITELNSNLYYRIRVEKNIKIPALKNLEVIPDKIYYFNRYHIYDKETLEPITIEASELEYEIPKQTVLKAVTHLKDDKIEITTYKRLKPKNFDVFNIKEKPQITNINKLPRIPKMKSKYVLNQMKNDTKYIQEIELFEIS